MSPLAVVLRLALSTLFHLGAALTVAWFKVKHGDAAGGIAAAAGLAMVGYTVAPDWEHVDALRKLLKERHEARQEG